MGCIRDALRNVVASLRDAHPSVIGLASRRAAATAVVLISVAIASTGYSAEEIKSTGETRDVLLMLDSGPLHIRISFLIGKSSPSAARQNAIDRLLKTLDTNGDGKLSREEAQRSPLFREKQ